MSKYIDFQVVKAIPIRVILERLGITPRVEKGDSIWYLAPWRSESSPSLHVRQSVNHWIDFGEPNSGTDNIDLVIRLGIAKTSYEAASWLCDQFCYKGPSIISLRYITSPDAASNQIDPNGCSQIQEIRPIAMGKLASYFIYERKIPFTVLSAYCSEIHFTSGAALTCYGAGIANIKGGYAVRNALMKVNVGPASVSLIGGGSKACAVFEGMTDYLSFETLFPGNEDDKVILNSVMLLEHALPLLADYQTIECYLDNDKAGQAATATMQDALGKVVQNQSSIYAGYKDLNDFLKAKQ